MFIAPLPVVWGLLATFISSVKVRFPECCHEVVIYHLHSLFHQYQCSSCYKWFFHEYYTLPHAYMLSSMDKHKVSFIGDLLSTNLWSFFRIVVTHLAALPFTTSVGTLKSQAIYSKFVGNSLNKYVKHFCLSLSISYELKH